MIIISRKNRLSFICIGIFLATCILPALGVHFKITTLLYWNHTASEPIGLYLAVPDPVKAGDKIVMRVPEDMKPYCYERGWMKENETMLKTAYALAGETYQITDTEMFVNHIKVGQVAKTDQKGLPLPQKQGEYVIAPGNFLPLATYKSNSFDGRYYGDVSTDLIVTKVMPIILIPEGLF